METNVSALLPSELLKLLLECDYVALIDSIALGIRRRLAIAEPDKCKAAFLRKHAEEAERGVLCTVDQMPSREVVERYESTGRL